MKNSLLFLFFVFMTSSLPAAITFKCQEDADAYLNYRYNKGAEYYNNESWRKASDEFERVIYFFPDTEDAARASYYLAVCYYYMKEYDFANEEFSNYLKASQHPEFFEDAISYKFCIAELFKNGKKRRPFKMRYLPKWISAHEAALEIYDEVVAALPNHELTVRALQSKAELLSTMGEYRDSIETYQSLIRRFPRDENVPEYYLKIAQTYYEQSKYEYQNPDILALAELNVRKFKDQFPRDERVEIAEETVEDIKELYAKGLCDLGLFYERLKKPEAAAIYFQSAIEEFPDTKVSKFCLYRLKCLGYGPQEEIAPSCVEEEQAPLEETPQVDVEPDNEQAFLEETSQVYQNNGQEMGVEEQPPYQEEPSFELVGTYTNYELPPQEEPISYEQDPVQTEPSTYVEEEQMIHDPYPWMYSGHVEQWDQSYEPELVLEQPSQVIDDNAPTYLHYSLLKKNKQNIAPR